MDSSFKKKVIRSIVFFSAGFLIVALIAFFTVNTYLPDYLLKKYISKSRELAQVLSRSMQDVSLKMPQEHLVRRMVQLNFPEERNFVNIVIRDRSGATMYMERGDSESVPLSEMLEKRKEGIEEVNDDATARIMQYKQKDVIYYTITSPIMQGGKQIGDVVVGLSKKFLTDRIELNRNQVTQLVFIASLSIVFLLTTSFLLIMRLFIKFKQSEERADSLRRMAYVGEISSGLAHEIRNPLNLMSINLQLMREGLESGDTDKIRKKIDVLENAKEHAARILSEFLGFARAKPVERDNFPVAHLVDEVLAMVEADALHRGVTLEKKQEDAGIIVKADRAELRQILLNLLINAFDAVATSDVRKVRVDFSARRHDLVFSVADSGCGMDDFTMKNIYTPFFSKKQGGTGLGLAVVRRIVEEYDGTIDCASAPGSGTEFCVVLKGIVQ